MSRIYGLSQDGVRRTLDAVSKVEQSRRRFLRPGLHRHPPGESDDAGDGSLPVPQYPGMLLGNVGVNNQVGATWATAVVSV